MVCCKMSATMRVRHSEDLPPKERLSTTAGVRAPLHLQGTLRGGSAAAIWQLMAHAPWLWCTGPPGCPRSSPVLGKALLRQHPTVTSPAHRHGSDTSAKRAHRHGSSAGGLRQGWTVTLVSGRTVGIGAYLARLGRRVVQRGDQPIILTGYAALNKLLGRDVYTSHLQLGGPKARLLGPHEPSATMHGAWRAFCRAVLPAPTAGAGRRRAGSV